MSNALRYLVKARLQEADELEKLSRTCELVLATSKLVHCLQRERGVSNLHVASSGQDHAARRQACMAASDEAQAGVQHWLEHIEDATGLSGGARLYTRIALALHALEGLPAIRADVDLKNCAITTVTQRFSHVVETLLALVFEAADIAVDPLISRQLIALFHLMQGKEFAGQERATGAAAFAAGEISAAQTRTLEYLIEMQDQALGRFESFAEGIQAEWRALQATLPLPELERLRRILLSAHGRPLDPSLAPAWFDCCSQRMDELFRVEGFLAGLLQATCRDKVAELRQHLENDEQLFAEAGLTDPLPPQATFTARVGPDADPGPVGPHLTQAVMEMLQKQEHRLLAVTEELASVRATLDERKVIERAKGLLMTHQGLSEENAYRLLRQNAMNQKRRLVEVAQALLSLSGILDAPK